MTVDVEKKATVPTAVDGATEGCDWLLLVNSLKHCSCLTTNIAECPVPNNANACRLIHGVVSALKTDCV